MTMFLWIRSLRCHFCKQTNLEKEHYILTQHILTLTHCILARIGNKKRNQTVIVSDIAACYCKKIVNYVAKNVASDEGEDCDSKLQ